ncbi:3-oxoacyl-[acyl-carrier protein] reductase [Saccharopolyspora kobensis]|uniref:3-oxoacyl-[acyl-carrier protein] reductase n=1 Tax=Saccharopolyspora kobensis TaxID=146035 RepID=A0A1H6AS04_9PSEU|nr:3-oxoacyl-ACP reductase FabG [Saccharopolyspora kobensis]SEG51509.1 3-oxoacyl-[acyl-carrier protein] reductase [Saccharopolyspora kobensis]SFE77893.1 3-oxoacyl-[acyl-carrier protein] reductase [Saccharopolyspora kobensis]
MLQDKVAVITGGGKGIGFAIAENFVSHGAKVVLADIDGAQAQEAAAELGGSALGVTCDVTDPDAVQAAIEAATGEFGALDVMVNNAGITRDATMRKMTLEDFEAVLDVHVKGAWLGTRAAAAVMREQGSGSIVNISSISGKVGMIGQTNYSAAKAGIVGLTKAAAKEVAHKGVRVNAVQPGLIRTDMTAALREDVWQAKLQEIPMQRAGEPSEVADVVLFLASGLSSYMTGCVLEITGGRHL